MLTGLGLTGGIVSVAASGAGLSSSSDPEGSGAVGAAFGLGLGLSSMAVLLAIGLPFVVWPDEPVPVVTATEPPRPESDEASIEDDEEARRSDPALLAATMRAQRIVAVVSWIASDGGVAMLMAGIYGRIQELTWVGAALAGGGAIGLLVAIGLHVEVSSRRRPTGSAARVTGGPGELGLGLAVGF